MPLLSESDAQVFEKIINVQVKLQWYKIALNYLKEGEDIQVIWVK